MYDKKELSILLPISKAYHRMSFAMAILMANEKYHFCINNYINIFMEPNFIKDIDNTFLSFENTDIKEVDIFNVEISDVGELSFDDIVSRIDSGSYLFFNNINENYIKNARYEGTDFRHNLLVWGYDRNENTINVMGYDKSNQMALYTTPFESLKMACNSVFGKTEMFSIRIKENIEEKIELIKIKDELECYLEGCPSDNGGYPSDLYGINAVYCLKHYLKCIEKGTYDKEKFDLKMFKFISDHKNIMSIRMRVLSTINENINSLITDYSGVVAISDKLRALSLKFFASGKEVLLQNMQKYLTDMIEKEKSIYSKLIYELDQMIVNNKEFTKELELCKYLK